MPIKDLEKRREYMRAWEAAHPGYQRKQQAKVRAEVRSHYGNKCVCCGEDEPAFLAIDHINGGGNAHRRKLGMPSGTQFYLWLRRNNFPEGFQILCFNCNFAKSAHGQCPHKNFGRK